MTSGRSADYADHPHQNEDHQIWSSLGALLQLLEARLLDLADLLVTHAITAPTTTMPAYVRMSRNSRFGATPSRSRTMIWPLT